MKINKPENSNYAGVVCEIKNIISLSNCDNLQHAVILGNLIVVDKTVKVGDVGIMFPLESQLSHEYCVYNNLYRDKDLNIDKNKGGYMELTRRIRCVKLRGNKSEGLFMPLESLDFITDLNKDELNIGLEFDTINDINICKKYVVVNQKSSGLGGGTKKAKQPKKSKLVENQFRFHQDTSMLYKNIHRILPETLISITYKCHGTSAISSKILCKLQLKWYEKLLKKLGVNIIDTQYDNIYSSRKVLKNEHFNSGEGFYGKDNDIWSITNKTLLDYLDNGMTIYYEVVGYLPSNKDIQKDFHYGCQIGQHQIYIYRITYTNTQGKVFEFSARQVQDWSKKMGLTPVPELYYGYAKDLYPVKEGQELNVWQEEFLEILKQKYNEKDCYLCIDKKVPEEGIVLRVESNELICYKLKSNAFYAYETAQLDKGESDIESEN